MPIDHAALVTLEYPKTLQLLAKETATSLGREAALALLPETDFAEAAARLAETEEAFRVLAEAAPPFGGLQNITPQVRRAMLGAVLDDGEFLACGGALYAMRRMRDFLQPRLIDLPLLAATAETLLPLPQLETAIERAISPEGGLKDSASPELTQIRREIRAGQRKVREKLESILNSSQYKKYFQEQLVTIRGDRYVIPVRHEYRQAFPGIVADVSGSGATVFIEPLAVVSLNNEVKRLLAAEKEEVERILRLLSAQVGQAGEAILQNLAAMSWLDLVFAKAKLAYNMDAVPPLFNREGLISLQKARHPLIAKETVVPVDIEAGGSVKTLIITGSNAGGKTVTLKTAGLFPLMAQSGLFLPAAQGTTVPVFDSVFADIGDGQSIEENLSTFSGQIKKLAHTVAAAGESSLVLLDEIAAGTDPKEGAALAMATLTALKDGGVTTIVTTHYSELKLFAYTTPGMENASVEFDQTSLMPTYRLLMGLPGSSHAFYIAARLGLRADIVDKARSYLDSGYQKMEEVLTGLEEERRAAATEKDALAALRRDAATLTARLERETQQLAARKKEILDKTRAEAAETLRQARYEAEEAIRALKALHNEDDARKRQTAVDRVRKELKNGPEFPEEPPPGQPLTPETARPGQWAYIPSLRQKGRIVSISGKEASLEIGSIKTTLPLAKCFPAPAEKDIPRKDKAPLTGSLSKAVSFRPEIDVRGKTIDEAVAELDKYIDDALLANAKQARVIHGKGTGALRKGLSAYFERHPAVRAAELAPLAEGGSGATVLYF